MMMQPDIPEPYDPEEDEDDGRQSRCRNRPY